MQGVEHEVNDDNKVYIDEEDLCGGEGFNTMQFTKGLLFEPLTHDDQIAETASQPPLGDHTEEAEMSETSARHPDPTAITTELNPKVSDTSGQLDQLHVEAGQINAGRLMPRPQPRPPMF